MICLLSIGYFPQSKSTCWCTTNPSLRATFTFCNFFFGVNRSFPPGPDQFIYLVLHVHKRDNLRLREDHQNLDLSARLPLIFASLQQTQNLGCGAHLTTNKFDHNSTTDNKTVFGGEGVNMFRPLHTTKEHKRGLIIILLTILRVFL